MEQYRVLGITEPYTDYNYYLVPRYITYPSNNFFIPDQNWAFHALQNVLEENKRLKRDNEELKQSVDKYKKEVMKSEGIGKNIDFLV